MSKLYNRYLEKKADKADKLYMFKSGNFYIFLGDDVIFYVRYFLCFKY